MIKFLLKEGDDMSKRIVTHLGIEYEVPEKFIESIEKNGVIFNNEYISYLFENSSPLSSKDLSFLIYLDIRNLKYIGSNGTLEELFILIKKGKLSRISKRYMTPH
jgi:hypothetical protein